MWSQYNILYFHGVTNTGGMWILHVKIHRFQVVQFYYCYIQTTGLCVIGQIIGGGFMTGKAYLGLFLLVVGRGPAVKGYSWCWIFIDPTKNDHLMDVLNILIHLLSEG